jgi:hypothetical protein
MPVCCIGLQPDLPESMEFWLDAEVASSNWESRLDGRVSVGHSPNRRSLSAMRYWRDPRGFLQAVVELLRPFTKQNDQLTVGIKTSCGIGIRKYVQEGARSRVNSESRKSPLARMKVLPTRSVDTRSFDSGRVLLKAEWRDLVMLNYEVDPALLLGNRIE